MSEEGNILEMDFGDLMSTSGADIKGPEPKPDDDVEVKKDLTDPTTPTVEDDDDLNVEKILETSKTTTEDDVDDVEKDTPTVEDKVDVPDSSKRTDDLSSDPFALVYAKFLLESGIISSFDEEAFKAVIEEEGEAGALQQLIQGEVDTAKNDVVASLEGYQKEYAELRDLGVNPQEAAGALSSLEDVEGISEDVVENEDNEQLRKSILTAFYQETTQFSDDRIKKLVDRTVELGEDVSEAKEALTGLKKVRKEYVENLKQTKQQEVEAQRKTQQEALQNLKTKIEGLSEVLPGQKINKQTKRKIEDMLTKPVKQLENGQVLNSVWAKRAENAIDFDIKLAHFIDLGLFDGKIDKLAKRAKSKAAEDLEKRLASERGYTGSGRMPARESSQEVKDNIKSMKDFFS